MARNSWSLLMHRYVSVVPKQEVKRSMHSSKTLFLEYISSVLYIGKVARGNSSLKMHKRRKTFSFECCQTWQEAEEWCTCLKYLQKNENTITFIMALNLQLSQWTPSESFFPDVFASIWYIFVVIMYTKCVESKI